MNLSAIDLMIPKKAPPFSRPGWLFELKYDGYRALASKDQLLTRNKKDASTWYPEILQALQKLRGTFVIDGEVCLLDGNGIPRFEALRGTTRPKHRGEELVTYFAFDLLFLNGKDLRELPLLERKEWLRELIPAGNPRLQYIDYLVEAGEAMLQYAVSIGMEGVVGKKADSRYVGGISRLWLKSKPAGFHDEGWKRAKRITRP